MDGAARVPTPIGQPCLQCNESIVEGDRGLMVAVYHSVFKSSVEPVHAECEVLPIVGHLVGVCSCTGYDTRTHAAALLAWQRLPELGRQ